MKIVSKKTGEESVISDKAWAELGELKLQKNFKIKDKGQSPPETEEPEPLTVPATTGRKSTTAANTANA